MPLAAKLNEFMFLSSVRVRSSSEPSGRTETLTSKRSEPFSISASEIPSSTTVWRSSWRKRFACSAEWRSGPGDDLDERRAGAVEVDERAVGAGDPPLGAAHVHVLGGVLLEVRPNDPDLELAVGRRQRQLPVDAERLVVLGDLVALGQVGIEVVLPVEDARSAISQPRARPSRIVISIASRVRHGQRPGMRQADRAGARVLAARSTRARSGRTSSSASSDGRGSRGR